MIYKMGKIKTTLDKVVDQVKLGKNMRSVFFVDNCCFPSVLIEIFLLEEEGVFIFEVIIRNFELELFEVGKYFELRDGPLRKVAFGVILEVIDYFDLSLS